jgi:hypothetical protein
MRFRHEDEDDQGVVPLIQPLQEMLDSVRPDMPSASSLGIG